GIKPVAFGARAEGLIVPDLHAVKFRALIVPPRPVAGKEPDRRPSLSVIAAAAGHGTHFEVIAFVAGRPKFEMTDDEGGALGSRQDIQMVRLHDEVGAVARPLPAPTPHVSVPSGALGAIGCRRIELREAGDGGAGLGRAEAVVEQRRSAVAARTADRAVRSA